MKQKTLITFAILSFLFLRGYGQDTYSEQFNFPVSNYEKESFKVEIQSGDIEIVGVSNDKISIIAEVFNAPGKNYKCGPDGCMNVEKDDFKFTIRPREGEKIKKIVAHIPQNIPISIRNLGMGSVSVNSLLGEIQIFTNRLNDIKLMQVIGPLSISGTYGDINVVFSKGITKKPMAISLLKGNISINLPKGEGVSIASLCPDEKSTLKEYPVKSIHSFDHKTDTTNYNVKQLDKRQISIDASYKERIETREFFGYADKKPLKIKRKTVYSKEDAWVYDINGGGASIELKVWQGNIYVTEK